MKTAIALLIITCVLVFGTAGVLSQQQQSGGQSVTVTNFPATQPVSIASMPSTPVTGPLTDTQLRASAVPVSLTSLPSTPAGANKIGTTYPYTSCGTTAFTIALQAMSTSSTAITSTTTCVLGVEISNTTGGALTVTLSDNQGTPVNFLNVVTINPGETRTYNWSNGRKFTSGIKVQASGSGVTYALEGLQ